METKEFQRWTAKRKVELLLQLIRGERKLVDVCREHDLKQSEDGHVRQRRGAQPQGPRRERAGGARGRGARAAGKDWRARAGAPTPEKNWRPCPGNPRPPSAGAGPDACGGE